MKTTVYIELPIEIDFSIDPGQKQTWDDPGFPASVEDISYDHDQVIKALDEAIYGEKSTIDEDLMEAAEEARRGYGAEKAEYFYGQIKDRQLEVAR